MQRLLRIVILGGLACLILALSVMGWGWWGSGRYEETTDNAYLRADITSLAPKVAGYIVDVRVDDNQQVKAGDILFRIDDRDYKARLAQADANIAAANAALANLEAERSLQDAAIAQAKAQLASAVAAQTLARLNFERYESLARSRTASEAQFEQAQAGSEQANAAVDGAKAALEAANRKLNALAAQKQAAEAALKQAEAARDLAQIDLDNTVVRAPVAGVIGNRQARVGRFVTTGTSLLDIVPVDNIWLVANFKEVQLEHIQPGQKARIRIDGYAHAEITGTVVSLAPGTGASFSLIPSDNATGNFVRVVQRVPVKITLDGNPLQGRLVPGLSARVAIRTTGSGGDAR
ncbi:HlyD family secretion protein [Brucella intermedia]|uniref:Membrane fusion protein (Multidrug efflux system) n=1 Tax=Pseudochelatococcus contaminans TaxID=1538103 RepID=A0A7W6EIK2_9HYPH|nr:membrane fusion protein (multidrug efflux system) [Pseudochelatococcus contaminans]